MSEKPAAGAAQGGTSSHANSSNPSPSASPIQDVPKSRPGNPAFRALGIPRIRLPSRNWLIFLSITGSFASAVIYDKYQTRKVQEKWTSLVSHIPDERLDTKSMPRKMTIYLAAPPGDGLRAAREHFHTYIKPVLVAAAMDWDVVEGRKEGDVRYKTAERIRRKRKRNGEGEPMSQEELDKLSIVDTMRERTGTHEFEGVAGDLIVGRHAWKEYLRGLHEGWLGPADPPQQPEVEHMPEAVKTTHTPGQPSLGDAAVKAAVNTVAGSSSSDLTADTSKSDFVDDASPSSETPATDAPAEEAKKEEEEKPKPRQPPPYMAPEQYSTATASPSIPDLIGPSTGIRFPHLLGFRNTPIRIYRFLNRRHLADSIGRDVAAAVLAAHRPYGTTTVKSDSGESIEKSELTEVLRHEERDWWKTTYRPREEHEESVWIEDMVIDERIASRMRAFQLNAEDKDRAKRIAEGKEKVLPARERDI